LSYEGNTNNFQLNNVFFDSRFFIN